MSSNYGRVDSDGYPMTMNDTWREMEAKAYRDKQEKRRKGHIPYASDRCKCEACTEERYERLSQLD